VSIDPQFHERYDDLLGASPDPDLARLVTDLDRAGSSPHAPVALAERIDSALASRSPVGKRAERSTWKRHRFGLASLALAAAVAVAGGAIAASNVVNLGKPASPPAYDPHFPLSGFHRISTSLHAGKKPEILFLGTLSDTFHIPGFDLRDQLSSIERWPLIKALDQFGSFTGVKAAPQQCTALKGYAGNLKLCDAPTFDWSHATYRSRYVAFVHADLLDAQGKTYQPLTQVERTLYYRYVRNPDSSTGIKIPGDKPDYIRTTVFAASFPGAAASRRFPLVLIGPYLQTVSQVVNVGEFQTTVYANGGVGPGTPVPSAQGALPFASIQKVLQQGGTTATSQYLFSAVNTEANIMTALICHADGAMPSTVCTRSAIRAILKHIK
jgi:hypothetical protein